MPRVCHDCSSKCVIINRECIPMLAHVYICVKHGAWQFPFATATIKISCDNVWDIRYDIHILIR